jgi:hypothetical protein
MSIESLSRVMPPPISPAESLGRWSDVEAALGTELPSDYKDFIQSYGSGTIGRFLSVFNPFSRHRGLNLLEQSKQQLEALRVLHADFGEPNPYPLHPLPGGLLPVAITDNGDVVHWLTDNKASKWSIVVNEARSPDYEHFEFNLTTFLERLLLKSIICRAFPTSIFDNRNEFEPI